MEDKLLFWIGTYSDERIIEILKETNSPLISRKMPDEEIKMEIIHKAKTPIAFTHFFAKDLSNAKRMAKEMKLKNFSQVSNTLHQQGIDY